MSPCDTVTSFGHMTSHRPRRFVMELYYGAAYYGASQRMKMV